MRWILLAVALSSSVAAMADRNVARVSLTRQVQPIFDRKCVVCHQEGSALGGLSLEEGQARPNLVGRRTSHLDMMRVSPGAPDASYLMLKLLPAGPGSKRRGAIMPIGGSLKPTEIALIRQWIAEGAIDN